MNLRLLNICYDGKIYHYYLLVDDDKQIQYKLTNNGDDSEFDSLHDNMADNDICNDNIRG